MNNITRFLNHRREKPVQEDLGHSQDWMSALPCLEFMKNIHHLGTIYELT